MNQLRILILGSLLLASCPILPAALGHTTEPGNYIKCVEGSDLFGPPECPDADEEHPVYFPFPYNCRQYYVCANNVARCIHCAPGTIWDQENLICNHESFVNCAVITTSQPTPITTPTITPTTTQPEACSTSDDPPSSWCPEGYVGLVRHPYDCKYFYNCDTGRRPCLFRCMQEYYFNPAEGYCDWPFNVPDCLGGSPPPGSTSD